MQLAELAFIFVDEACIVLRYSNNNVLFLLRFLDERLWHSLPFTPHN